VQSSVKVYRIFAASAKQHTYLLVVMMSPSGAAFVGGGMSRRDEEFHQMLIVLEHSCDVDQITKVMLAFCCPFWAEQ